MANKNLLMVHQNYFIIIIENADFSPFSIAKLFYALSSSQVKCLLSQQ